MDKKTDSSRGYGFVDVATQEDADRALRANGSVFHGRVLGVERVRPAGAPNPKSRTTHLTPAPASDLAGPRMVVHE